MKKFILLPVLMIVCTYSMGQIIKPVRQDTTILKADECKWLVEGDMAGRSVPEVILDAILAGKLKATDPQTNETIPGSKIFTWRQAADTVMVRDEKTQKDMFRVVQREIKPEHINSIRVYHDWSFDIITGKLQATIKYIELMQDVYSPDGTFRGYRTFCRLE